MSIPFYKVTEGHVGHYIWAPYPFLYEDPASELPTGQVYLCSRSKLKGPSISENNSMDHHETNAMPHSQKLEWGSVTT